MSVVCRGLQIWNRIDDGFKVLPFISTFKRQVKNIIICLFMDYWVVCV